MEIKTIHGRYEKIMQWVFRTIVLAITLGYGISLFVLPNETDEYFQVSQENESTVSAESEILYHGTVYTLSEDGTKQEITLPAKCDIKAGETLTVYSLLPEDYEEDYIVLRSSQQNIRMYVDGELRLNYTTLESRPVGSQTTSRFVFCKTTAKDAGKVLKIELVSDAKAYSGIVNTIYATDRFSFWQYMFHTNGSETMFGLVVMFIGFFTVIISLCMWFGFRLSMGLENIGCCAVFIGLWLTAESRMRQLLTRNTSSMSNLCFLVVMLAPIPLFSYINEIQGGRYRKVYKAVTGISLADFVVLNFLQIFNIADYLDTLVVANTILGVSLLIAVIIFVTDAKKHHLKEHSFMVVGLISLFASVVFELVSAFFVTMLSGAILMLGVLVFTIFAFIDTIKGIRSRDKKRQKEQLLAQKRHSDAMTMQTICTVTNTLEAKNQYTKGHSGRVAEYSAILANRLGMPKEEITRLYYASMLHDIGNASVPDTIFNKPAKLSEEEYDIVKKHTTIGADILSNSELISFAADVARYHHERYDGTGYPEGLSGEKIPYTARIVSLADAYDAMNSERAYRKVLSKEEIRREIQSQRGLQFDPQMTDVFLTLLDEGELEAVEHMAADENSIFSNGEWEQAKEAGQMVSMVMETIQSREEEDKLDVLTGLLRRYIGEQEIMKRMAQGNGALVFFDMDNLKKINDIHGHKAGDYALKTLGEILKNVSEDSVASRIGGDEFLLYLSGRTKEQVADTITGVISQFVEKQKENCDIAEASLSAGVCMNVPTDCYEEIFNKADKALYYVKQRGKNGFYFYQEENRNKLNKDNRMNLNTLVGSIRTSGCYSGAMNIEYREFTKLFEYVKKVCERYEHTCHLVLVTLETGDRDISIEQMEEVMDCMGTAIRENIRNVDICTRYSADQYMMILLEAGELNIHTIMKRIFDKYHSLLENSEFLPFYQYYSIQPEEKEEDNWIKENIE